ncbi:PE-PPE domain-containing protein [Mycobacterium sp. SMC-4]|uniref:PE-PPE domain-containing protein n=1 Tax=Mycobacterium sp. SMC-4 TaxID=2857059 RepID=UPI0021B480DD|nr:PE-PPE domain-containing protein [Mycobacterium sp. SMC-4]UXA21062.1 PE-PPE domain-containing protein [Mycobacterium sp. SMC-4]
MSKVRNGVIGNAVAVIAAGLAVTVGGAAATHPASIASPLVDLSALIVVGSSTHPDPTGNENFFGGKFNQAPYNPGGQPGPNLIGVDFGGGAAAINAALQANSGEDNAVLSSGWGAANASLLLSRLHRAGDPVLPTTLFILDNNVSRPNGGFGTRYPLFALIGVNPFPSPTDTAAAAVIDIAYQYNYNSNAPADLLNIVAHVNSLVAYLYGYREQSEIELPVDVDGRPAVSCGAANTCAVLTGGDAIACDDARCTPPADDRVVAYVTTRGNTTYVTYTTEELPLTRLIRQVLGNTIADASAPLLKLIVDSGYYDGNPIPSDPSRYRPARLGPSPGELADTMAKVPGAIRAGLDTLSDRRNQEPAADVRADAAAATEPVIDDELHTPQEHLDLRENGFEEAEETVEDKFGSATDAAPSDPETVTSSARESSPDTKRERRSPGARAIRP